MTRIGFLGLGRMGAPMAQCLLRGGYDLAVWNRTAGRTEAIAEAWQVSVATTPQEAVAGRDLVITMLSDRHAVAEVVGELTFDQGTILVEMSTIGPEAVRLLRQTLPRHVSLIDAPVLGSVPQANAGELHIFAGGSADVLQRCENVLTTLGTVEQCGPLGSGAAMKLVVNLANITSIVALGEALGLACAFGLDRDHVFGALARTALGQLATKMRPRIEDPASPVVFEARLAEESLRLALEAGATDNGVTDGARRQLSIGLDAGLDISAAIRRLSME